MSRASEQSSTKNRHFFKTEKREDACEKARKIMWEQHRQFVKNVQPVVDDKAQKLAYHMYLNSALLSGEANKLAYIVHENKKMVNRINSINRSQGTVICHAPKPEPIETNFVKRKQAKERTDIENLDLITRIIKKESNYPLKEFEAFWKHMEQVMDDMTRYPLFWKEKKKDNSIEGSMLDIFHRPLLQKRPRCFFDIVLENGLYLGRIVFQLYPDYVPKTVENFISLCNGDQNLSYKNCPIHRIVSKLLCTGGDITQFDGSGGMSIYGEMFDDENYALRHGSAGVLSMANSGINTNNSQFYLTFKELVTLNGKNVVFGKIVRGLKILHKIEDYGSVTGKPKAKVFIENCGQI